MIAKEFGASDIVEARGDAAAEALMEMTHGIGADAALECMGTAQAIATAFAMPGRARRWGWSGCPTPTYRRLRPHAVTIRLIKAVQ